MISVLYSVDRGSELEYKNIVIALGKKIHFRITCTSISKVSKIARVAKGILLYHYRAEFNYNGNHCDYIRVPRVKTLISLANN